jgi:hypothetical protein
MRLLECQERQETGAETVTETRTARGGKRHLQETVGRKVGEGEGMWESGYGVAEDGLREGFRRTPQPQDPPCLCS